MKAFIFSALAAALVAPAAFAGPATPAQDAPAVLSVRHNDLDLTTRKGARLMINRLDEAAAAVCGEGTYAAREYKQSLRSTACYQDSMNRALADLGSPTVNALYQQRAINVAAK